MSEMTGKEEIGMRSKTLHRREWLNKLGTNTGFSRPNDDVVIGPVTIAKIAGGWIVTLRENGEATVVYYEHIVNGSSISEGHVKRTLQILRVSMVLEDLADV